MRQAATASSTPNSSNSDSSSSIDSGLGITNMVVLVDLLRQCAVLVGLRAQRNSSR
jgi:hypothetical protein